MAVVESLQRCCWSFLSFSILSLGCVRALPGPTWSLQRKGGNRNGLSHSHIVEHWVHTALRHVQIFLVVGHFLTPQNNMLLHKWLNKITQLDLYVVIIFTEKQTEADRPTHGSTAVLDVVLLKSTS